MDKLDRKIIAELQRNGRLTNQELSERVSLSPSPCLRRVRQLEREGVIEGYTAIVNQEA
ncbi:MAG: Lrp/AsnC family transcriptional regulator, partial [Gammaproteobacteria bacterium]